MKADHEKCHRCDRETDWIPIRGGRALKCAGCGDRFPCRHACDHFDCADAREFAGLAEKNANASFPIGGHPAFQ